MCVVEGGERPEAWVMGSGASRRCGLLDVDAEEMAGLDWTKLDLATLDGTGLDWTALECTGLTWTVLDFPGLDDLKPNDAGFVGTGRRWSWIWFGFLFWFWGCPGVLFSCGGRFAGRAAARKQKMAIKYEAESKMADKTLQTLSLIH